MKPPCWECPKSLGKGKPNPDAELSEQNLLAYLLYCEVKAGRPMPDDPIVHRNCALFRMVEDQVERRRAGLVPTLFAKFITLKATYG